MQIQGIFIINLVFKFNFQLCHQIIFCFTCKCNINVFQTTNPRIIWPICMEIYKLVHIPCLKMTSLKHSQNGSNRKNVFYFYLASWDAKYMSCYYNNVGKKIVLYTTKIRGIYSFQHQLDTNRI